MLACYKYWVTLRNNTTKIVLVDRFGSQYQVVEYNRVVNGVLCVGTAPVVTTPVKQVLPDQRDSDDAESKGAVCSHRCYRWYPEAQ